MASDSFTATNGTALQDHTGGGVTWAGINIMDTQGQIQSNVACAGGDYASVSARASNSTVDYSQVVFKAGAYAGESKAVNVRSTGSTQGYWLQVNSVVGDNITAFFLIKGDGIGLTLVDLSGSPISRLSDHTVAIKATTVGSDVQIQAWIDGSPVTFEKTDNDTETPSTTFTDLAANTPITAVGNPGFLCYFFEGIDASNSGFDDWTDVEPGEPTEVTITSISDATLTHGQTGVVIGGTTFGASQGTGRVVISPTDDIDDVNSVNQTITSWSDTSITFTADLDTFAFGTLYVFVENDDDESNADGEAIARIVASATFSVTLVDETGAPAASQSGITLKIWRNPTPIGITPQDITGLSTDGSGVLTSAITLGSLDDGDYVCWLAFRGDPATQFGAGRKQPSYA